MSRRTVLTAVVALSAFGLTAGLTASLGVASDQLGAGTQVVASCDDLIDLSYGVTAGATNTLASVTMSGVDASCAGQAATLSIMDTANGVIETLNVASLAIDADGNVAIPASGTTDVATVGNVSLVITGADATPPVA